MGVSLWDAMMPIVTEPLSEGVLAEIEGRLTGVLGVVPPPWVPYLETRYAVGGESFVRFEGDPAAEDEMYLNLVLDGAPVPSPDPRLDFVVDFVGKAAHDIQVLLAEVRRLRALETG